MQVAHPHRNSSIGELLQYEHHTGVSGRLVMVHQVVRIHVHAHVVAHRHDFPHCRDLVAESIMRPRQRVIWGHEKVTRHNAYGTLLLRELEERF